MSPLLLVILALGAQLGAGLRKLEDQTVLAAGELPGCEVYHNNQCRGDQISTDDSFADYKWFTPLAGDEGHLPSFQDYGRLVAYAQVVYAADRRSATVEIRAEHKDASAALTYVFDGAEQTSPQRRFDVSQQGPVTVEVRGSDGARIEIEPLDFLWAAPAVADRPGDFRGGQKGAIVELFGWPHADVERECPHLAKMGYLGVKLFPAMEQLMASEPFENVLNPWYFMYQPVSYRLGGRMGSREQLRKAIHTCRRHGVRVYADAVINHMTGSGNDGNTAHRNPSAGCAKWGNKTSSLPGGHSPFYTQGFTYTENPRTGKPPLQEFPAVPYGPLDFRCERPLNSWTSPTILNAGWLSGLTDLDTGRESVRERIAAYLTDMLGLGFSGFRVDAAKHIRPDDLVAIFGKLKRNLGGRLPGDFLSWLEVLLGGEADLLICNRNSGYNFGSYLPAALAKAGFSEEDAMKIKTWNSGYPKETERGMDDCAYSGRSAWRQAIQNDDHDQQNPGSSSRDMQQAGCVLIKNCDESTHRRFEEQLFSHPNGARDNSNDFPIRLILSSFYWGEGKVAGIPDGWSDCSRCTKNCHTCKGMPYVQAYSATSRGYDKGAGQYTRVHRDEGIVNAMRGWMGLPGISAQEYANAAVASDDPPPARDPAPAPAPAPAAVEDHRVEAEQDRADIGSDDLPAPSVDHTDEQENFAPLSGKTVFVMLQLDTVNNGGALADKGKLSWMLDKLRDAGADGFMVDVWWGLTELRPKVYNFNAYKELVQMAEERSLRVQFVASFHTCGGNVNDACNIPLPAFVYENHDIWYRDQERRENKEYISLFADDVRLKDGRTPLEMYGDWFAALAGAFKDKLGKTVVEVQVGMGPAGELRYPSYSFANGWQFCGIGAFQSFDKHALASLAAAGRSRGWTGPPTDAGSYNSKPWETGFFNGGFRSEYGKFFLDWYSGALKAHGAQVLQRARKAFGSKVELAGKVSGIHWWYGSESHAAELTAGYYNTNMRNAYAEIAQVFRPTGTALDFTCLEMRNEHITWECQAKPQDLVFQVAEAAGRNGVTFNGENALPRYDEQAYDQILKWREHLHAFTYLRLSDELVGSGFRSFANFVRRVHG